MEHEHDDDLSNDAQSFLRSVRDADGPTAADRARVRRAVSAALVASTAAVSTTVASSAAASSAATVATTSTLALATKVTLAALLVTGLGAAVVFSAPSVRGPDEPAPGARANEPREDLPRDAPAPAIEQTIEQTIEQAAARPIEQTGEQTSAQPEQTIEQTIEQAAGRPIEQTGEQAAGRPIEQTGEQAVTQSADPAADSRAERPAPREERTDRPALATRADRGLSPSLPRTLREATPSEAVAPTPSPASTLPLELPMMRQARAAIARGDHAAALDALRDHETRFPNGVLAIERDAARALASCQSGAPDGASRGAMFLASHGAHPMADRVADACGITR